MRTLLKTYLTKKKEYSEHYNKVSFSQCGEDRIMEHVFILRGITTPSYIDLGANHPYYLNNTAIFYKAGSTGINIEANSQLINLFKVHRPKDLNLNFGVGPQEGEMDFYIFEDDTLSTFSIEEVEQQKSLGRSLLAVNKVKLKHLNRLVNEYCDGKFPDILSIDLEGIDFEVLKSTDFSASKPKVICAETAEYSPIGAGKKRTDYINYILSLGYCLYADTNLNSIFVDHDFWFNYKNAA